MFALQARAWVWTPKSHLKKNKKMWQCLVITPVSGRWAQMNCVGPVFGQASLSVQYPVNEISQMKIIKWTAIKIVLCMCTCTCEHTHTPTHTKSTVFSAWHQHSKENMTNLKLVAGYICRMLASHSGKELSERQWKSTRFAHLPGLSIIMLIAYDMYFTVTLKLHETLKLFFKIFVS